MLPTLQGSVASVARSYMFYIIDRLRPHNFIL